MRRGARSETTARQQRLIRTVLRKGIRFVGTVREAEELSESRAVAGPRTRASSRVRRNRRRRKRRPRPLREQPASASTRPALAAVIYADGGPGRVDTEDLETVLQEAGRRRGRNRAAATAGSRCGYRPRACWRCSARAIALEDHAIRACRAALEIDAEAARRYEEPHPRDGCAGYRARWCCVPIRRPRSRSQGVFGLCLQRAQRLAGSGQFADVAATQATYALAKNARRVCRSWPAIALDAELPRRYRSIRPQAGDRSWATCTRIGSGGSSDAMSRWRR